MSEYVAIRVILSYSLLSSPSSCVKFLQEFFFSVISCHPVLNPKWKTNKTYTDLNQNQSPSVWLTFQLEQQLLRQDFPSTKRQDCVINTAKVCLSEFAEVVWKLINQCRSEQGRGCEQRIPEGDWQCYDRPSGSDSLLLTNYRISAVSTGSTGGRQKSSNFSQIICLILYCHDNSKKAAGKQVFLINKYSKCYLHLSPKVLVHLTDLLVLPTCFLSHAGKTQMLLPWK